MNAVSKHVYTENFEKIFEWYRENVHRADEDLYTSWDRLNNSEYGYAWV